MSLFRRETAPRKSQDVACLRAVMSKQDIEAAVYAEHCRLHCSKHTLAEEQRAFGDQPFAGACVRPCVRL